MDGLSVCSYVKRWRMTHKKGGSPLYIKYILHFHLKRAVFFYSSTTRKKKRYDNSLCDDAHARGGFTSHWDGKEKKKTYPPPSNKKCWKVSNSPTKWKKVKIISKENIKVDKFPSWRGWPTIYDRCPGLHPWVTDEYRCYTWAPVCHTHNKRFYNKRGDVCKNCRTHLSHLVWHLIEYKRERNQFYPHRWRPPGFSLAGWV